MKVMKFGGTSVSSATDIKRVKEIIDAVKEPVVVVVSAFKGITDQLLLASSLASKGDEKYAKVYDEIFSLHMDIIKELELSSDEKASLLNEVNILFDELSRIFKGVFLINDLSIKTSDKIISYGERLSSIILTAGFQNLEYLDALHIIKTEATFDSHIPIMPVTNQLIKNAFDRSSKRVIIAGFISTSLAKGEITNLGRGGSDYTAAIIAAALSAEILEIWSDVDGFMSADPKVISNTHVIKNLSYTEALELCNFGAKIIYPPTIFPVFHKNIPIRIRNSFRPEEPGTLISEDGHDENTKALIKGISSINNTCLLTVSGMGMVGIIGINHRIFKTLAQNGVSVFLVSQASSENSISIGLRSEDAALAQQVLEKEYEIEIKLGTVNRMLIEHDLATVAIVGENMKYTPGIAGRLFSTLGKSGISVIACAQGASEANISFVIKSQFLRKALNSLHDSFFLSEYKAINLFIVGIGTVGGNLIEQIRHQRPKLMEQFALKINVVGVARGSKALFNRKGICLDNYREELEVKGIPSSNEVLKEHILDMNIFNAVFIDCTANESVSTLYLDMLKNSISVVTANKIATSSSYENYKLLKNTARERDIKFLFETNVGAGLPVINTMNALINSGDRITKIEAVLSGTLNFIFNNLSKDVPFSKAIMMAKEAGFAEPDPRIDLSGTDVVRKLVILTREADYRVEQSDVKKNLFVPQKYFDGSLDEFWATIHELDTHFENLRQRLESENKKLRFVAKYENGRCEVGLQEIEQNHPFYDLEGSNNIVQITTERYKEYPMIIKGYGAGASVTAAGVFADIISIANIR